MDPAAAMLGVGLRDVEAAREALRGIAWRTPLLPASRDEDGVFLKLECLQRLGSFKVRGIWNRMRAVPEDERKLGFVTVSAGNAGQAVAWSARKMGAPCTVYVPENASPPKVEAIRAMGADIREEPLAEIMDAMATPDLAWAGQATYVHPFGHPLVVAGHGSIGLEILEDLPDVATVCVAVGGGGLSGGVATALKLVKPGVRIVGVQAEGAAPFVASWQSGNMERVEKPATFADGMKGTRVFPYMWPLLRARLDDAVTVSESELEAAVRHLARESRVVAEGAGAAGLAAAWKLRGAVPEPIVAIVSGGNIDPALHARIVAG